MELPIIETVAGSGDMRGDPWELETTEEVLMADGGMAMSSGVGEMLVWTLAGRGRRSGVDREDIVGVAVGDSVAALLLAERKVEGRAGNERALSAVLDMAPSRGEAGRLAGWQAGRTRWPCVVVPETVRGGGGRKGESSGLAEQLRHWEGVRGYRGQHLLGTAQGWLAPVE